MSADDQLDSNRIRQMAALRRSAYRTRSYCVIALGGCIVGSAQVIFDGVRRWRAEPDFHGILIAVGYFFAGIAFLMFAVHFGRLAGRHHHEAKKSALESPSEPPDFSRLQDGSQTVRNLEDLQP